MGTRHRPFRSALALLAGLALMPPAALADILPASPRAAAVHLDFAITIVRSLHFRVDGSEPGSGPVTLVVRGNAGQVAITTSNDSDDSTALVAPTGGGGKVTNRMATATLAYPDTAVRTAGTYGGLANGGRVTYTATTP